MYNLSAHRLYTAHVHNDFQTAALNDKETNESSKAIHQLTVQTDTILSRLAPFRCRYETLLSSKNNPKVRFTYTKLLFPSIGTGWTARTTPACMVGLEGSLNGNRRRLINNFLNPRARKKYFPFFYRTVDFQSTRLAIMGYNSEIHFTL